MTTRLFASGDRKIENIFVSDDIPTPSQVAQGYAKVATLFGEAKATPEGEGAVVHRIEVIVKPEVEK